MSSRETIHIKNTFDEALEDEISALKSQLEKAKNAITNSEKKFAEKEKSYIEKIKYLENQLKLFRYNQFAKKSECSNSFQLSLL